VVILTLVLQQIADTIMRATMREATYLFIALVAGSMGLLAWLLVRLIYRQYWQE